MIDAPPIDRRSFPAGAALSTLTLADGWAVRFFELEPDGKARGTILIANGRGDFMEKYIEIFAHLAALGWRVASFDWRGQGGSGRLSPDPQAGHIDDFAPWIDDFAEIATKVRRSDEAFVLFGHSMGGHLVLRALTEERIACDAAILSAPMLGIRSPGISQGVASMVARTIARLGDPARRAWKGSTTGAEIQKNLTNDDTRYADEIWWREQNPALALGAPSWGWIRAAYRSILSSFTAERLARVTMPVLILNAEADRLVDARFTDRVAPLLPQAKLVRFGAEASHELLREVDAVRLRAFGEIDAFLDAQFPQ